MKHWIIICGNPTDGFEYIGPFSSFEDAHKEVNEDGNIDDHEWWITELTAPEIVTT